MPGDGLGVRSALCVPLHRNDGFIHVCVRSKISFRPSTKTITMQSGFSEIGEGFPSRLLCECKDVRWKGIDPIISFRRSSCRLQRTRRSHPWRTRHRRPRRRVVSFSSRNSGGGDGERHLVFIHIDPLGGGIVPGVVGWWSLPQRSEEYHPLPGSPCRARLPWHPGPRSQRGSGCQRN